VIFGGKVFESVLNLLTLVLMLFLVYLLGVRYLVRSPESAAPETIRVGSAMHLPGVDWATDRKTLVMALQIGCRWCEASASFYRRLLTGRPAAKFRPIAVLPQPVGDSRTFLNGLGLEISDVRQVDLADLGVQATPTLIVVDEQGRVESSWMGQLSSSREDAIVKELGVTLGSEKENVAAPEHELEVSSNLVSATQLVALIKSREQLPIIDVRPREEYRTGHLAGALNIPVEELQVRAPHEIPRDGNIVIYCHYWGACESAERTEGIATFCANAETWMRKLGFARVMVLQADLDQLHSVGLKVEGSTHEDTPSPATLISPQS
jgi:hypothetical protein